MRATVGVRVEGASSSSASSVFARYDAHDLLAHATNRVRSLQGMILISLIGGGGVVDVVAPIVPEVVVESAAPIVVRCWFFVFVVS